MHPVHVLGEGEVVEYGAVGLLAASTLCLQSAAVMQPGAAPVTPTVMINEQADDRTLAEAVSRDGDEWAFRLLFRRHSPVLSGFLRRIVADGSADCEDLVQETWIRALPALARFRWEASFRTWLLGIGYNVARRELRRPAPEELPAELPAGRRDPLEERIDLTRAIAALPHGFRTVLVLYDIYGFTHDQIAGLLGISPGTSKSQLSRARAAVRARISGGYMEVEHG
jgi:RNA polymerase sigma factor (sigma-70 family)